MHIQSLVPRLFLGKRYFAGFFYMARLGHCSTVANASYSVQVYHMTVKVPCFHHFGGARGLYFYIFGRFLGRLGHCLTAVLYMQDIVSRSAYVKNISCFHHFGGTYGILTRNGFTISKHSCRF
jgi:hypothetical protein